MTNKPYDVIIRGGGIAGCTLGLILARQGIRTLIIDAAPHPRFALGESVLKPTVLWLRVMAARFGVNELAVLANLNRIHTRIGTTSGVKKSFGFVRHRVGNSRTEAHWWANIAVSYGEDVLEGHLFRQDTDAYLYARAAAAGCDLAVGAISETPSSDSDRPIRLETTRGVVEGDYLVDCSGPLHSLPRLADLGEQPTRLRTNSRSIFTHMIGVRPFDDCGAAPAPALPWHQGTLHHILDGAWAWVIPFDNHPRSSNPLVSVGVNFDNHEHPERGQTPEQEWAALLARYPALRAQFQSAVPVRPWISTGRVQHATRAVAGDRCCVLGQAAGNVDALYSRGLLNTFQGIFLLAELLLDAVRQRDYGRANFAPLERLQRNLLQVHDDLVCGSYIAFRSIPLTTWWLAMWSFTERHSLTHVAAPLAALEQRDTQAWAAARAELMRGDCISSQSAILPALDAACTAMERLAAGECDESAAMAQLRAIEAPLIALGFSLESFRELATRHGFGRTAARLLTTEHALTAAIEVIDEHADLPVTLRVSTFVNALVRLLALRYARVDDVSLAGPELANALLKVIEKIAPPGSEFGLWRALVANLHTLSLRRISTDAQPPPAAAQTGAWRVLLDCCADGRHVCLRIKQGHTNESGGPELDQIELDTHAGRERHIVNLAGHTPSAALLGDLA